MLLLVTSVADGKEEINKNESLNEMGVDGWYFYHWLEDDLKQNIIQLGFEIKSWKKEELIFERPSVVYVLASKPDR